MLFEILITTAPHTLEMLMHSAVTEVNRGCIVSVSYTMLIKRTILKMKM